MCSQHSLMLPVATQSTHPIYTLFRDHEEEMVGMECQDEMVEMESQEAKARGETLVRRDHLACQVCMHFDTYIPILIINTLHAGNYLHVTVNTEIKFIRQRSKWQALLSKFYPFPGV